MKLSPHLLLAVAVVLGAISQVEARSVGGYWRRHPHLHYVSSYRRLRSNSHNNAKHHHRH